MSCLFADRLSHVKRDEGGGGRLGWTARRGFTQAEAAALEGGVGGGALNACLSFNSSCEFY